MRFSIAILFLKSILVLNFGLYAQTSAPLNGWRTHAPFKNSVGIHIQGEEIFLGAPPGMWSFNRIEGTHTSYTKAEGFNGVNVSNIGGDAARNLIIIAYNDGLIDVYKKGQIFRMAQLLSAPIQGSKKINRIRINQNHAWLAADFGIVSLNLNNNSISNSVTFSDDINFSSERASDIALWNGYLYVALSNGLWRIAQNDNFKNLTLWEPINAFSGATIKALQTWNQDLCIAFKRSTGSDSLIFLKPDGAYTSLNQSIPGEINNLRLAQNHLLIIADSSVLRLDPSLNPIELFSLNLGPFNDADIDPAGILWMSSSRYGLIRGSGAEWVFTGGPNRPFSTAVYKLRFLPNGDMWVASGALTPLFAPVYRVDQLFYRENNVWKHLKANNPGSPVIHQDLISIAIDPKNPNKAIAGSHASGLYKIEQFQITENIQGSPLQQAMGGTYPIGGIDFDNKGNVWFSQSFVSNALYRLSPDGTYTPFSFPGFAGTAITKDVVVDLGGKIWMSVIGRGIAVLNPETNERRLLTNQFNNGDLNDLTIRTMHRDKNGEIWVGTNDGIRVFSPSGVFNNPNYNAQKIVIRADDGNNELLLVQTIINDIRSDGGNRKWIATQAGGAVLVSSDGRKIIHAFTAENSPLLSNNVLTLDIDPISGEVYFGTDKGICSFRGDATEADDSFGDVYVFPNPVRENYQGPITISGLARDADIKITDIAGNLVFETKSIGGQATWNGIRYDGKRPQTGIYLVFCTNRNGNEALVTKFLFVR